MLALRPHSLLLILVLITGLIAPHVAVAQTQHHCVIREYKSVCVRGPLYDFWSDHGGVTVFGEPVAAEYIQATGDERFRVQQFDHADLAYTARSGVLVGHLGNATEALSAVESIGATSTHVNEFWRGVFAAEGWDYTAPSGVVQFVQPATPECGTAVVPENVGPFYCVAKQTIYIDQVFLEDVYNALGSMVITTSIAHEWGHHVQLLRGITGEHYTLKQRELQADCFAGVYLRYATSTDVLQAGDVARAKSFLRSIGARHSGAETDPAAHGTAQQRVAVFDQGFANGIDGCSLSTTGTYASDPHTFGLTQLQSSQPARIRQPRLRYQPI